MDRAEQNTIGVAALAERTAAASELKFWAGKEPASQVGLSMTAIEIAERELHFDRTLSPFEKAILLDRVRLEAWLRAHGIERRIDAVSRDFQREPELARKADVSGMGMAPSSLAQPFWEHPAPALN